MSEGYFYGFTRYGHRLHLGTESLTNTLFQSYCGIDLETCSLEGWQPQRVEEFCRTCFRATAWKVFEEWCQTQALATQPKITLLKPRRLAMAQ